MADIRLRNINKEYILKRTEETESLERDIEELESILKSQRKVKGIIKKELSEIIKKYEQPRKTSIIYDSEIEEYSEEDHIEDYPVTLFLSKEGYFKKITPQSLRMSGEQKYKEGDGPKRSFEASNRAEMLVFTDKAQVYKTRASEFADTKASALGVYLPGILKMDEGENVIDMVLPGDYTGSLLFFYENGKAAKVALESYATKTNRKKLTGAYSDKSRLMSIVALKTDTQIAAVSTEDRAIVFPSELVALKASRATQGVNVLTLKKKYTLKEARLLEDTAIKNTARYRVKTIPAAGALLKPEDRGEEQMSILD